MHPLDFIVLFAYLTVVTGIALWAGRKQTSAQSFFLADRNLPWWMIMLSVVATETSVLTFLSVPGIAYQSDLGFLQLAIGYILGRWVVARLLLPHYFEQGIESTYEFILNRWGPGVQRLTSLVFLITRILADGVRLFMTAIPLALITGWSYPFSILVIGIFTLIYTLVGGIRSVIWADSIQFGIYLVGALVAFMTIHSLVDGGWGAIFQSAGAAGKLRLFHLSIHGGIRDILFHPYHFITAVLGGVFLSMASHGTDHLMVQRLMAARDVVAGRKALIGSGFLVFFQFAIFLVLGSGLWVLYGGEEINSNEVFSKFMVEAIPVGLTGLILAAIFSAAMSTLSSSINALASSTLTDWIKSARPERYNLAVSRLLSVFWALVLIGGASLFTSQKSPLVEVGLTIASFTYGGLLGFFVLGRAKRRFRQTSVVIGFVSSLVVISLVRGLTEIAWPWFTVMGMGTMIIVSRLIEWLSQDLRDA
ncbi:MAG: sodium:solute symporter [Candidatus Neomarinimicrobiota bacterium]